MPAAIMLPLAGIAAVSGVTDKPKYNVLFLVADDLRPELGCYGQSNMKTPNLDALARRGTAFTRAYCQVAVCNPSRVSVLSGMRPDTSGVYDNSKYMRPQMPAVVALPQLFKNHGYHTISVGKIYHHSESEPGNDPMSWSEPMYGFMRPYRHWYNKESMDFANQLRKQGKRPRSYPYEASEQPDDAYPDGKTARKAVELLRQNKNKPFFLAVGFVKPHLPLTCPQKYWDLYPNETIKLPDNYYRTKDAPSCAFHSNYELRSYGGVPQTGDVTDEMAHNLIRGYRACVSYMDAQVGVVLDELERLGLRDNTIVVFWSDHGYHLGENRLWTKMTNFELGTHVPLIISMPGQKTTGKPNNALVELVDIYPTLAQLCGLPAPKELEGTSMVPLLENPGKKWKTAAYSQYGRGRSSRFMPENGDPMGRSIRTEAHRYTEWRKADGELVGVELYDQGADPKNNVNIAGRPENKELIKKLAEQLNNGWRHSRPSMN